MVARFKRASDGTDQRFDAQITVKCSPSSDEDHCFVYGPKEQAVQTGFIDILDTQDLDDPIVVTTCGDQSTQTNGCEPFKPFARLSVDQAFVDALYHYFRISRNDPLALPGSYGRMLYFSATTITTLGLGDITPVTNTARFYVGLEAVLGIVIAGFFLNAMARTIADRAASKVEDRRST